MMPSTSKSNGRWVKKPISKQESLGFVPGKVMPSTSKSNQRWGKKPISKPKQRWQVKQPRRNWLELPLDVTANILHRVGAIDILENVQKVCTSWRKICEDPAMWRVIDMHNGGDLHDMPYDLKKMCMHAVDRSEGQLVDINIESFGNNELLQYIADRSCQMSRLCLVKCYSITSNGLSEAVKKLPLLEKLHISYTSISVEAIEITGRFCPLLKSFKLNKDCIHWSHVECDKDAHAIAANMPQLRHLQLIGNDMTNDGLKAILGGCPHLESLDLRCCSNVSLGGNLGKMCSERIKDLRRPNDSTEDCGFDDETYSYQSFDEEYPSEISDFDLWSSDDPNEDYEFSGDQGQTHYGAMWDQGSDDCFNLFY